MAERAEQQAAGFDPSVLDPPWSFHAQLRDQNPVVDIPELGFYLVSRYDDVIRVLKDAKTFSSSFPDRFGTGMSFQPATPAKEEAHAKGYHWEPTLFFTDGVDHRRHRKAVQQAFSPRRVRQIEGQIQELADEIVGALDPTAPIDFATQVAFPLPVMVIGEALGISREDRANFKRWADAPPTRLGAQQLTEAEDIALIEAYVESQHYFAGEIAKRQEHRTDDLLSDLVNAHLDGEDALTLEELLAIVTLLPVAGTETSAALIGLTMHHLLTEPADLRRVREDPAYLDAVIEETLRHQGPIQAWFRRATEDTQMSGTVIPKDTMVLAVIASANRDERHFKCPADFSPGRENIKDHVAFGWGPHYCVGASLARAEARIAIATFLRRFPDVRLSSESEPRHRVNLVHRMLETLVVTVR